MLLARRSTAACLVATVALTCSPGVATASPFSVRIERVEEPAGEPAPPDPNAQDPLVDENPREMEARAAYRAGTREYAMGNFEQAVGYFERAFELSQRKELLYNLAQAYRRWYEIDPDVGYLRKSKKLYENYLAFLDAEPEPDPAAVAEAREGMAAAERMLAEHEANNPAGGEDDNDRKVHQKAWFWVVVVGSVAAVAGGVTAGVLLSRDDSTGPELGTVGRAPGLGFSF